jgi:prepilin-type processing-associated H-X9-DG protein
MVELLVVLAILGVFVAIALPVTSEMKVAGNKAKCLSNQRQIGIAFHLYANEHAGLLPPTMHSTASWRREQSWVFQLEPYLEDIDKIRVCPADEPERQRKILEEGFTSYVLNDLVFDNHQHNSLLKIPYPSKTMLLAILSADNGPSTTWDHIHGGEWTSWAAVANDIEPDRHRAGARAPERTKGSANFLYADGSVRNISASELKARVDQGFNPARVPTE